MINQQSQSCDRNEQEFNSKSVIVGVIRSFEFKVDEIYSGKTGGEEEDFHRGVVDGHEVCEEVKIPGCVGQGEEELGFTTDT